MVRVLFLTPNGEVNRSVKVEDLDRILDQGQGVLWVDMNAEDVQQNEIVLRDIFKFHPLAVDDALREIHVPKIDDWGSYLYLVLHAADQQDDGEPIESMELDIFMGKGFLVTYHNRPVNAVERVWQACCHETSHLKKGACHLLYRVADELVEEYMPVIERLDNAVELLEDEIFNNPRRPVFEKIIEIKSSALYLRRIIAPQRDVLSKLGRVNYWMIEPDERIYFQDVYDHLVRIYDISDGLRTQVSDVLEIYLSVVNNRMNDIMKTLTIITTLFMPLSCLTGFFGMNFFQAHASLDFFTSYGMLALVLLVMIVTPLAMFLWMRYRTWL